MKRLSIMLIFVFALSFFIQAEEVRNALVIGNSNYKQGSLVNPANDAKAISDALKTKGFNVKLYINVETQNDMKKIVREFTDKIKSEGGIALFYYAGHGVQIKGLNYLVPVGAMINNEAEVEYEALDLGFVLSLMEFAGTKLNICILDACRDNPFAKSFRSASDRGLAVVAKSPASTIIAYSTSQGSVASDGTGKNGLYTEELLKAITKNDIYIEDVFKLAGKNVEDRTKGAQRPWVNSSFYGQFSFAPVNKNEKASVTNTEADKKPLENKKVSVNEEAITSAIIVTVVSKARIFIDGKFIADISPDKKISLNNITLGAHKIEIDYGTQKERRDITVIRDKPVVLSFNTKVKNETVPEIKDQMVFVEGGTFLMGDTIGKGYENERPVHKVRLYSYWIGRYEVTVKEFKAFVDETGYKTYAEAAGGTLYWAGSRFEFQNNLNWKNPYWKTTDEHPVSHLNWYDCIEYCNWRSKKEGLSSYYNIDKTKKDPYNGDDKDIFKWNVTINESANGYRLPTEAEWEYAARGGKYSKNTLYSGSNNPDSVGNFGSNNVSSFSKAGKKKPNELGIYDMSGNVYEFCWDWLDEYLPGEQINPKGPVSGKYRVIRGGSILVSADKAIITYRTKRSINNAAVDLGFRLAKNKIKKD